MMIFGLIFHIVFTTLGLIYLNRQVRSHRAALIALAHALRLMAERQVENRKSREGEWN
jgi:hypothetical protein